MLPMAVVRGRQNPLHFGFARRLRQARKFAGVSRSALSMSSELDRSAVSDLEADKRVPRLDTVERLAGVLRLSPCTLAFGIEQPWVPGEGALCSGISSRLHEARTERGLSILALAKLAKVSHTAVSNVENGTMPTLATAEALATALKVSPCWLSFGVGPQVLPSRRASRAPLPSADH